MTLREALAAAGQNVLPKTPFYAEFRGDQVLVRCVLDRTAVYELHGERKLARLELLKPVGELEWLSGDIHRGTGLRMSDISRSRRRRGKGITVRPKSGGEKRG